MLSTKIVIDPQASSHTPHRFIWKFFIIALIANSTTFFFEMSYLFMSNKQIPMTCIPPRFQQKNITNTQLQLLSFDSCSVYNFDYEKRFENLSTLSEMSLKRLSEENETEIASCFDVGGKFAFEEEEGKDIRVDFEIVCEKLENFNVEKLVSGGFALGSVFFGIFGDM